MHCRVLFFVWFYTSCQSFDQVLPLLLVVRQACLIFKANSWTTVIDHCIRAFAFLSLCLENLRKRELTLNSDILYASTLKEAHLKKIKTKHSKIDSVMKMSQYLFRTSVPREKCYGTIGY